MLVSTLASLCLSLAGAESLGNFADLGHGHAGLNHSVQISDVKNAGFGVQINRIFRVDNPLPLGEIELIKAKWTKSTECDDNLGWAWTFDTNGVTSAQPLKLYTNKAGSSSGIGIVIYDYMPLAQQRWTTSHPIVSPAPSNTAFHLDIAFRNGNQQCSTTSASNNVGEVLIVNPGGEGQGNSKIISITEPTEPNGDDNWQRGSCFDQMGWHYFLNTAGKTLPSGFVPGWTKGDLFPVVPMYHEGALNAIFFTNSKRQSSGKDCNKIDPRVKTCNNNWDMRDLLDYQMCGNFCGACGWTAVNEEEKGNWGTMHIFFGDDFLNIQCPASAPCVAPRNETTKRPGMGCCYDDDSRSTFAETKETIAESVPRVTSKDGLWAVVCGGLGLLVGGAVLGLVVSQRQRRASEVEVSEMSSNLPPS